MPLTRKDKFLLLSDNFWDWIKNRADFFVEVQPLLFNFVCTTKTESNNAQK